MLAFILSSIVLPVLLAICVGLPLSIYAGFICGRMILFREIQNRVNETIMANSGPFDNSTEIRRALTAIEILSVISRRLDDQGNSAFAQSAFQIELKMTEVLRQLESDFVVSEVRHKTDPPSRIIPNETCRELYSIVDNGCASLAYLLSWRLTA